MVSGMKLPPRGIAGIKRKGNLSFDFEKIATALAPDVIGHIKRRTAKGMDIEDKPFKPYSARYKEQLVAMGEDASHVDLWLTGGLVGSVHYVGKRIENDRLIMTFSPDTGTSASVTARPNSGRVRSKSKGQPVPVASRTGKRSPEHNVLGYWLHKGKGNLPPRPWLGISPTGMKQLLNKLARLGFVKSK